MGEALLGGLEIPDDGMRVVLRHALALEVHEAEAELRGGVPLLGQRTAEPQRRDVVTALICSSGFPQVVPPPQRRSGRARERRQHREL